MELMDATTDSLTVTWPATENASRYVLEYRMEDEEEDFQVLSNKLTQTQARKRNLSGPRGFYFRAGAIVNGGRGRRRNSRSAAAASAPPRSRRTSINEEDAYVPHEEDDDDDEDEDDTVDQSSWVSNYQPYYLLSKTDQKLQMEAPTVTDAYSNLAVMVSWKAKTKARANDESTKYCYELQMRENRGGEPWTTIAASLTSLEVKKKNLSSPLGYQFRVRPVPEHNDDNDKNNDQHQGLSFSPPSTPIIAKGLSPAMKRWFQGLEQGTLIKSGGTGKIKEPMISMSLADALGGKEFILFYASAHWCGPCRQFTPKLVSWYHASSAPRPVEVVFLSCDHDEDGFQKYFWAYKQPWFAVDYDDVAREQIIASLSVSGIPRLVVMHAESGRIIVDNAVGQTLDILKWRQLAAEAAASSASSSSSSNTRTSFAGNPSSAATRSPVGGRKSSVF